MEEEKEEEKKKALTPEGVQKLIKAVKIVSGVLAMTGIVLLVSGLWLENISLQLSGAILLIAIAGYFLAGIRIIKRPKMWVMQVLGQFYDVFYEGPHLFLPFLVRREAERTQAIFKIELFTDKPVVNFKGGGSAVLVEPIGWFQIDDAEVTVYNIEDYIGASKEATEDAVRTVINNTRVENVVGSLAKEKTETAETFKGFKKAVSEVFNSQLRDIVGSMLEETLKEYGLKMAGRKLTITDYNWSEEVLATMRAIYEQRQQKVISEHTAEARRIEIGEAIGKIKETLQKVFEFPKDKAEEVAPEIFKHITASDKGQLKLIKWESKGGEGISLPEIMAKVITAMDMFRETKKGEGEKGEGEEERKVKKILEEWKKG